MDKLSACQYWVADANFGSCLQNFQDDPKQFGAPLPHRYHNFLSDPGLPPVVLVSLYLHVPLQAQQGGSVGAFCIAAGSVSNKVGEV